ncbi:pentatricopeptide repeat-containing protein At4g16470 isoform X1 [Cannabis sativa]|uniref:pentatricopeptide repeat-containing protein At4g16470 isoform X1 n=1 Tax=Cannabis sativa TaxID=3483 RepID=UPI0029CA8F06|nr:pentatricopeptide repeat-containing protein At4g16470 isoform X1 [Cannabis sativa]
MSLVKYLCRFTVMLSFESVPTHPFRSVGERQKSKAAAQLKALFTLVSFTIELPNCKTLKPLKPYLSLCYSPLFLSLSPKYMKAISRMKSLVSQTPFPCSQLSQKTHLALFSLATKSNQHNPTTTFLQKSNLLHLKPISCFPKTPCSLVQIQNRGLQMERESRTLRSGEVHVIVGPMFAGKTTTLLRRIQSEKSNGSFQVKPLTNNLQLDKTLKFLCFSGNLKEAVSLLCHSGIQVKTKTYALLLQECVYIKEYNSGRRIHAQMIVLGFVPNEYLKTKLLILYAKSGGLRTAHILFDKLLEKNLVSWNAIIAGYFQKGLTEMGLNLYYKMRQSGFIPDQYTFASVFRAFASLAALEHGKQAHGLLIKCNSMDNVIVNSALLDMYVKGSSLSDAHLVFDTSINKNVITWTSLISGYGLHGRVNKVLELFHRMKAEGVRPNYVTFLSVLCACSHGGLIDEGWEHFSSMKHYGIQPREQHYSAMVNLLGRAGRLKEAYEFILSSPFKEHSVIWGALLGACRVHGDMNLLKLAEKKYFELEPENAGKYEVLANAYATFGLWENVAKVRAAMKESGMIKEPAFSKIEVQREVHFFHKGDKTHLQSEEIYEMIEAITCILKDVGYIPEYNDG